MKNIGEGSPVLLQESPRFTSPGLCPWPSEKRLRRLRSAHARRFALVDCNS